MTVLAVLTVLESTLPSFACPTKFYLQHNEATVAVFDGFGGFGAFGRDGYPP